MKETSVTIIGEISPLWQILMVFGQFYYGLFGVWQTFVHTWTIFPLFGNFLVVNGQRLKNNLAIWSHWRRCQLGLNNFSKGDQKIVFEVHR